MAKNTGPYLDEPSAGLLAGHTCDLGRALLGITLGLSKAATAITSASRALEGRQSSTPDPVTGHLAAAADSLVAGRDLLRTHLDDDTGQGRAGSR